MIDSWLQQQDRLPAERFAWGTLRWLCNDALSPGAQQTLGICHIYPGHGNALHFHPNCEEVLYMLSGTGEHRLDAETVILQPGSVLRIPAGVQHNLRNIGDDEIVCIICFSSGQRETVFLEDMRPMASP